MRRRALLAASGTALVTALSGCVGLLSGPDDGTATETTPGTSTGGTPTEGNPVTLSEYELVREREGTADELVKVVGFAKNVTDDRLADVTVTATFLDGGETALGNAVGEIDELGSGRTWSFELYFPGSGEDARGVADFDLAVSVK